MSLRFLLGSPLRPGNGSHSRRGDAAGYLFLFPIGSFRMLVPGLLAFVKFYAILDLTD